MFAWLVTGRPLKYVLFPFPCQQTSMQRYKSFAIIGEESSLLSKDRG